GVRVDSVERGSDLIRPALAWRPGAPGNKPPGAIEGFGFTVTVGMTSLAGCSGEDFASVLRSLGYHMEKRPKPAEPPPSALAEAVPPAASADAPPPEDAASDQAPALAADIVPVAGATPATPPAETTAEATASSAGGETAP